ncbi:GNAT family N-acetyltransferase [Capnocytophaga cynodegmi]|uniref:GNAT family N-acetyltransferase n=1 Tax=Capnocytophaga cynodegmi TaxID=28189 RepID=UPI00385C6688
MIKIEKYNSSLSNKWNNFVREAKNGLFFFERDFMDYHSDRFTDHSLLIFKGDTILAILPANEKDDIIYSHQGLTFGSLLMSKKIKVSEVLTIFEEIKTYYKLLGFSKLIYKAIPYPFVSYPAQEDLYALFRNNAKLIRRDISSIIELNNKIEFSSSKKNQVNKLTKLGFSIKEEKDYTSFWELLNYILLKHHNVQSVHTLEEISLLANRKPNNVKLFTLTDEAELLAGIVVFIFGDLVHTQYMSNSDNGRKRGALSFINYYLINEVFKNKKYYSFGISTENNGQFLNEGLISQKEEMGARGICLDTYEMNLL